MTDYSPATGELKVPLAAGDARFFCLPQCSPTDSFDPFPEPARDEQIPAPTRNRLLLILIHTHGRSGNGQVVATANLYVA